MSTSDLDRLRNSVEEYLRIGPAQSMLLARFEAAVDAKARADERERIAKSVGEYLGLLHQIHEVYRHIRMDTEKERKIHRRHVENADNAFELIRSIARNGGGES